MVVYRQFNLDILKAFNSYFGSVSTFVECVAGIKMKICLYLQNTINLECGKIGNIFCVRLSVNQRLKRINKSQNLDLLDFIKCGNISGNGVVHKVMKQKHV